ncbi:MAG TPA: hypothetical protein VNB90_10620 [Cytophagaceae bacterium]|nr:hypothetical protein [Cytophagaceae bacterium]
MENFTFSALVATLLSLIISSCQAVGYMFRSGKISGFFLLAAAVVAAISFTIHWLKTHPMQEEWFHNSKPH